MIVIENEVTPTYTATDVLRVAATLCELRENEAHPSLISQRERLVGRLREAAAAPGDERNTLLLNGIQFLVYAPLPVGSCASK
jgi:hypothetical protein